MSLYINTVHSIAADIQESRPCLVAQKHRQKLFLPPKLCPPLRRALLPLQVPVALVVTIAYLAVTVKDQDKRSMRENISIFLKSALTLVAVALTTKQSHATLAHAPLDRLNSLQTRPTRQSTRPLQIHWPLVGQARHRMWHTIFATSFGRKLSKQCVCPAS